LVEETGFEINELDLMKENDIFAHEGEVGYHLNEKHGEFSRHMYNYEYPYFNPLCLRDDFNLLDMRIVLITIWKSAIGI
jgi:hypothetical protein